MDEPMTFWDEETTAKARLESLLGTAMCRVACGLSAMVGRPINVEAPRIERIPIGTMTENAGASEMEMVGIYLLVQGDMAGQALLMIPLRNALRLVDLLMEMPPGTTTSLGDLEHSALAEAGNVATSSFLNEMALLTGVSSRPSPPAVMVDMLGAILDVMAAQATAVSDSLLILETLFRDAEKNVQARFWILPDPTVSILPLTAGANRGW